MNAADLPPGLAARADLERIAFLDERAAEGCARRLAGSRDADEVTVPGGPGPLHLDPGRRGDRAGGFHLRRDVQDREG